MEVERSEQGLLGQKLVSEFHSPPVTPSYMHVIIVHIS